MTQVNDTAATHTPAHSAVESATKLLSTKPKTLGTPLSTSIKKQSANNSTSATSNDAQLNTLQQQDHQIQQRIQQIKQQQQLELQKIKQQQEAKQQQVILEQQKAKQRQQIAANQQKANHLYLQCWNDPACKPMINQKFGPWNLPDCIATDQVGICWDYRHGHIIQ
jgi:TolA-binding protein